MFVIIVWLIIKIKMTNCYRDMITAGARIEFLYGHWFDQGKLGNTRLNGLIKASWAPQDLMV